METKEYKTIDREAAGWPSGFWDNEPDKAQWPDGATGLPCLAVRHPRRGHWCGYVGVAPDHALHGRGYDELDVEVHGGLTFADACSPNSDESRGVCHVPAVGEPEHVWWFGFDCDHGDDYSPQDQKYANERGGVFARDYDETYKSLFYVQRECASLAQQLIATASLDRVSGPRNDDVADAWVVLGFQKKEKEMSRPRNEIEEDLEDVQAALGTHLIVEVLLDIREQFKRIEAKLADAEEKANGSSD
jgi:hypothetical protein